MQLTCNECGAEFLGTCQELCSVCFVAMMEREKLVYVPPQQKRKEKPLTAKEQAKKNRWEQQTKAG